MDRHENIRQLGYQKGFDDANKTGGRIIQENIARYLNAETKRLSIVHAKEFITGWYEGFNDGAVEVVCKLATNDDFWKNNIYWENPLYKSR